MWEWYRVCHVEDQFVDSRYRYCVEEVRKATLKVAAIFNGKGFQLQGILHRAWWEGWEDVFKRAMDKVWTSGL